MASLVKDKPYVPTWKPPVSVNPLIRACRWTALIGGIVYGYQRMNQLAEPAQCQRNDYLARQVGIKLDGFLKSENQLICPSLRLSVGPLCHNCHNEELIVVSASTFR